MVVCKTCKQDKPRSDYSRAQLKKKQRAQCKACLKARKLGSAAKAKLAEQAQEEPQKSEEGCGACVEKEGVEDLNLLPGEGPIEVKKQEIEIEEEEELEPGTLELNPGNAIMLGADSEEDQMKVRARPKWYYEIDEELMDAFESQNSGFRNTLMERFAKSCVDDSPLLQELCTFFDKEYVLDWIGWCLGAERFTSGVWDQDFPTFKEIPVSPILFCAWRRYPAQRSKDQLQWLKKNERKYKRGVLDQYDKLFTNFKGKKKG